MLSLLENTLHGTMHSLGQLTRLTFLAVAFNNLTGTIPLSLYNASTIEYFYVGMNNLEGQIPYNLGHTLSNLKEFSFIGNHSGQFPASISNASNLVVFNVHQNNLTGNIPSLAKLSNLENFGVSHNHLGYAKNGDMDFLGDISNCTNLVYLSGQDNNLGGTIPETIGNVTGTTRLRVIAFGRNLISGNIPTGIGNLINLEVIGLEYNNLTGPIPSTVGKLRQMSFITLDVNQLSGTIPSALRNLTSLSRMFLGWNNLQGPIPSSLGDTMLCGGFPELKLVACASDVVKKDALSRKIKLDIIISCSVVGFLLVLSLVMLLLCSQRRNKSTLVSSVGMSLPRVSYGDLSKATDGFSSIIGVGSVGSVYKGISNHDNKLIAVKVLNLNVSHALKSFMLECESLRTIKHRNLVKLVTVCSRE